MTIPPEVMDAVCQELANGKSLSDALRACGGPARSTFYKVIAADNELADKYARAKADGLESLADDIIAIADEVHVVDARDKAGNIIDVTVDATAVARNRLRVDSRKWLLSKLAPKKYGDKIEHEHKGGIAVSLQPTDAGL